MTDQELIVEELPDGRIRLKGNLGQVVNWCNKRDYHKITNKEMLTDIYKLNNINISVNNIRTKKVVD